MTNEEFDKTSFRKGDKIKIKSGIWLIIAVDFMDREFTLYDGQFAWTVEPHQVIEYIPKT
jgi:hypothetical protein